MTEGMIVCPQPIAAKVGQDVFRDGGNAFDAAVAVAFAQGVIDPQMCGIGGWGNMTCASGDGEDLEETIFYARVPKRFPPHLWEEKMLSRNPEGGGEMLSGLKIAMTGILPWLNAFIHVKTGSLAVEIPAVIVEVWLNGLYKLLKTATEHKLLSRTS